MCDLKKLQRAARCGALLVVGTLLLALAGAPGRAALPTYVDRVSAGLSDLSAGKPDGAASALRAALRLDANHPAAWLAYGALLLDTRNVDAARRCFARAADLAPASPRPRMGLALCDLAAGDAKEADRLFAEAAKRGGHSAVLHRAYLAAMENRADEARRLLEGADPEAASSPLGLALKAQLGASGGSAGWQAVLAALDGGEHDPLLAAFTAWKPFNYGWQARPSLPMPPSAPAQAVSGSIPLTGQTSADTTSVVFSVDGAVSGITNVRPFTWTWDTAAYPNGWHTLRMTATRADGSSVSRERRVWTKNKGAAEPPEYEGMADVNAALDAALALRPDVRYARYVLAQEALAAHDTATARRRLQGILGEDPKYWNAANLLKSLPRTGSTAEIWRGPQTAKRIALTFDDGPNPNRTPGLLDLLDHIHVPATFFIVGKQAVQYPEVVRRMAASGHEVENHTWNHRNMAKLTESEALRELASNNRLLTELAGRAPRFFRPPGGNISAEAREAAAELGMSPAMWTFASGKSEGLPVEDMVPAFVNAAKPGAIYLVHNGTDKILEILPVVVQRLRAQGYEFVTLEELLSGSSPSVTVAGDGSTAQPPSHQG